jgi:hypothetical protein
VDRTGNIYAAGSTESEDFPVKNPMQKTNAGGSDAFVVKISSEGVILFSTFLGGSAFDSVRYLGLDAEDNIYLTGATESKDFPIRNALQSANAGGSDVFITKINSEGSAILFSTFLGGSLHDTGSGIAVGSDSSIYVAGTTESKDFPTKNQFQSANSDLPYAFMTKIKQSGVKGKR